MSPARDETSGSSMRRGRSTSTAELLDHPPGPADDSSTTRSPRRTASRTLWVTNRTREAAIAPEALELVVEEVAGHGVEGAERLVHEQDLGLLGEGAGEGDPLAHAAGQLVRALGGEAVEVHGAQQRLGPLPALLAADAAQAQRQLDVAGAR